MVLTWNWLRGMDGRPCIWQPGKAIVRSFFIYLLTTAKNTKSSAVLADIYYKVWHGLACIGLDRKSATLVDLIWTHLQDERNIYYILLRWLRKVINLLPSLLILSKRLFFKLPEKNRGFCVFIWRNLHRASWTFYLKRCLSSKAVLTHFCG